MPSVTTPGLSTAPTGVTSFVPSLRVSALLDGSPFSIRPSTGVLRFGAVGALLDVDRRVRERLGYFVVDEQHRASVVLNDLVIVLQRVGKDPQARIRAAET